MRWLLASSGPYTIVFSKAFRFLYWTFVLGFHLCIGAAPLYVLLYLCVLVLPPSGLVYLLYWPVDICIYMAVMATN